MCHHNCFLLLSRSIPHQMTSSSSIPGLVDLTALVQVVKIALFSVLEPLREPRPDFKCPNLGPLLLFRDADEKEFSEERNHRVNFRKISGVICLPVDLHSRDQIPRPNCLSEWTQGLKAISRHSTLWHWGYFFWREMECSSRCSILRDWRYFFWIEMDCSSGRSTLRDWGDFSLDCMKCSSRCSTLREALTYFVTT
jgi:hypothetical protein